MTDDAYSGDMDLSAFGEGTDSGRPVLETLLRQAASGALSVVSREGVLSVSLRQGWIVGISPNQEPADLGLGDLLVEQGYLGRVDLDQLLEVAHSGGRTIRELLLERGLIPTEALSAALQEWVEETLLVAFSWEDATFQFHPGSRPVVAAGLTPFPLIDFLFASRERLGPRSPLPPNAPEATAVFRLVGEWDAERSTESGELSELELQVLSGLNEGRSLSSVARGMGVSSETVRVLAAWLEREGRITRVVQDVTWGPSPGESDEATEVQEAENVSAWPGERKRSATRQPISGTASGAVLCTGLACLAVVGLALSLWLKPTDWLVPSPWTRTVREEWTGAQRASANRTLDLAAVTYALLEGRWPEGAAPLIREGLVSSQDVQHLESGFSMPSTPPTAAKEERSPENGAGAEPVQFDQSDNFLLRQHAAQTEDASGQAPLKLLD